MSSSNKSLRRSSPLRCELLEDRVVPATANEDQISRLYTDLLNREANATDLAIWSNHLNNGVTLTQAALLIQISPEGRNETVRELYDSALGRVPDQPSLNFWSAQLLKYSVEVVQAHIFGSEEYFLKAGGTNGAYLTALYQDILGRSIDPSGANYFGGELNSGMSRAQIAAQLLTSDAGRLELVRGYYQKYLGREPEVAGLNLWLSQLKAGVPDQVVISKIASSPEAQQPVTPVSNVQIVVPATQSNANGTTVSGVAVTTTGANTDPLTFTATNLPPGLSINSATGIISGTISSTGSFNSPYNVQVSVTQGTTTSTGNFTWVVPISSTSTLPFSLTDDGWITLPSGTRYKDVTVGTGTAAAVNDVINVDYIGYLTDGTIFDSNNGISFTLKSGLGGVIDGWVDAIQGMKPGGVRLLDIPSTEGYGSTPRTGIPANSELVFRVKLNSVT